MGQFDGQFHEVTTTSRPAGDRIDFSRIISEGSGGGSAPAPVERQRQAAPESVAAQPAPVPRPNSAYVSRDTDSDTPPRPGASESTDNQMANLVGNAAILGASGLTIKAFAASQRKTEIEGFLKLESVVKPETLATVRNQTDELVKLVAAKSREADADVNLIAAEKPHAFEEIREPMPAKGPGQPPAELVYKQPKAVGSMTAEETAALSEGKVAGLTSAEWQVADRATYLRGMERVLVKDFNMPGNTTVGAFRQRQPVIEGLGNTEAAHAEGISKHLLDLEKSSGFALEETTTGRLAVHNATTGKILKGAAIIGGSFLAEKAIDHTFYGSKNQGLLTTAFDCAAPLLVFTKASAVAKIGMMIGGHELLRGIEAMSADKTER